MDSFFLFPAAPASRAAVGLSSFELTCPTCKQNVNLKKGKVVKGKNWREETYNCPTEKCQFDITVKTEYRRIK